MENIVETIPYAQIESLLGMIATYNREIKMSLGAGYTETSLAVRQSKYLRDRYLRELNTLLRENDINLQDLPA
jgi:hypothetical protein